MSAYELWSGILHNPLMTGYTLVFILLMCMHHACAICTTVYASCLCNMYSCVCIMLVQYVLIGLIVCYLTNHIIKQMFTIQSYCIDLIIY